MKHQILYFSIIIGCLLPFYITGCGTDEEDKEPANTAPTVDSYIVPKEFTPGDVLEFKVIAHDDDGDMLSYTWEIDGKILESTGTSVKWTAPDDVESVKVTVHISDGEGNTTKRVKTISNKEFITPEPVDPSDGKIDEAPDPPLNLIVPGKGAFGVKLGDPFKKVEALHGKSDGPIGVDGLFSYWEDPDLGFSGFVDGIRLVEHIFLHRPNKAKTAGKIGIGSKIDNIQKAFGNAEEVDDDDFGRKRHWYWKRGIEFSIDEDGNVWSIFVFKPVAGAPGGIKAQPIKEAEKNAAAELQRRRRMQSSPSDN